MTLGFIGVGGIARGQCICGNAVSARVRALERVRALKSARRGLLTSLNIGSAALAMPPPADNATRGCGWPGGSKQTEKRCLRL